MLLAQTNLISVFCLYPWQFHQYQVVGRALPTEKDVQPKIYRMKLWATNEVRAKSKFWLVLSLSLSLLFFILVVELSTGCVNFMFVILIRYFLRKLKKVKKSNGQMLAINEVYTFSLPIYIVLGNVVNRVTCPASNCV